LNLQKPGYLQYIANIPAALNHALNAAYVYFVFPPMRIFPLGLHLGIFLIVHVGYKQWTLHQQQMTSLNQWPDQ